MTAPNSNDTQKRASADVGRYLSLAERFCEKKFGTVEGKESILAATVLALAIRESAQDLTDSIDASTSELERIVGELSSIDMSFGSLSLGMEDISRSVTDVADRAG